MQNKVLIIGLDGGTWKILCPMMENGIMPNLKRLVDSGSSGVLKSTIPPITAAAWTSFQTGVNPGKHGIIDFQAFDMNTKKTRLVNSNDIKIDTILEIASRHNRKVISINMPMTFPPKHVNGVIIGGLLSPGVDRRFAYPEYVYDRFIKGQGYRITAGRLEKRASMSLRDFVEEQIRVEDRRFKLAKQLMKESEWDLFIVHNQLMDGIQHALYSYLDPDSEKYDEQKNNIIGKFYKETDRFIGEILENAKQNTTFIIMSDHGHYEVSAFVNLNAWLRKKGYLKLTSKRFFGNIVALIRQLDFLKVEKRILGKFVKSSTFTAEMARKLNTNVINWSRSRAFMINGGMWGNLYCEDEASAQQIIEELENFTDPIAGVKVVKKIYKKKEVFNGPFTKQLPNLFLEPNCRYAFHAPLLKDMKTFQRPDIDRFERVGVHGLDGIIVFNGHNIKGSNNIKADITDVMPTILSILGLPIPSYIDGSVLGHIFVRKPKKEFEKGLLLKTDKAKPYTREDVQTIKKRLKDLGYI